MNYFALMRLGINKYETLYRNNPRKAAMKIIWRNIRYLFSPQKKKHNLPDNRINILCNLAGGLGDILINLNFLLHFQKRFSKNISIDIIVPSKFYDDIKVFLRTHKFIGGYTRTLLLKSRDMI